MATLDEELDRVLAGKPAPPKIMASHEPTARLVRTSNERLGGKPTLADTYKWMFDRAAKGASFGLADFPWDEGTRRKFTQLDKTKIGVGRANVSGQFVMEQIGGMVPVSRGASIFKGIGGRALRAIRGRAERKVSEEVLEHEISSESRRRAANRLAATRGVMNPDTAQRVSHALQSKAATNITNTTAQEAGQRVVKTTKVSPTTLRPLTKKGKPIVSAKKIETSGTSARKLTKGGSSPTVHDLTEIDLYGPMVQSAPSQAGIASRLGAREGFKRLSPAVVMSTRGNPAIMIRPPQFTDPAVYSNLARVLPYMTGSVGAAAGELSPVVAHRWPSHDEEQPFDPNDPFDMELMRILGNAR